MRLDSGFRPDGDTGLAAAAVRASAPPPWAHHPEAGPAAARVLLLESADGDAEVVATFLRSLGHAGLERVLLGRALDRLRDERPAVVLLHCAPGAADEELRLLAALREDARLRHLPVVVLDASGQPGVRREALELGAADVLACPFDASELALRLRNLLAAVAYRDHLAHQDALTCLPTRAALCTMLSRVVAGAVAQGCAGAVLQVGVDGLRRVNEALGYAVGDQVLQRLAKRFAASVHTEAEGELSAQGLDPALYRLEGGEFAIVIPRMEGLHGAAAFISKIMEDGALACHPHGAPEVFVTCSMGVAVFPRDGTDPDALLCNAGLALREARRSGPNRYEFFAPGLRTAARQRLGEGGELRHAVRRDQVELLYRPVVDPAAGRLVGTQALLRWRRSCGGIVEGAALADLATASEMDRVFTEWTFEQLRNHVRNWRAAGLQPVPVRLPVSLASVRAGDLLQLVQAAAASGLDARLLVLELRHGTASPDLPALAALRSAGVRLALDRFGAKGSPEHLRDFAYDEVKVDLSWTKGEDPAARGPALALGLRELARVMRVACVGAGVETPEQLGLLRAQGWDQVQGDAVGAPLPGLEFAARWLARSGQRQRAPWSGRS